MNNSSIERGTMKKENITQEQTLTSAKKNIPDFEVIVLEQDDNAGTSQSESLQAPDAPEPRLQRKSFLHSPFLRKAMQDELASEELKSDEPVHETPSQESVVQNSDADDFIIEDLVPEEPVIVKPIFKKHFIEEPAIEKPVATKPVEVKPAQTKPVAEKPVATKPIEVKPAQTKPAETKPVAEKSAVEKPIQQTPDAATHDNASWEETHEPIDILEEDMYAHKKSSISGTAIFDKIRPYLNTHVLLIAVVLIVVTCIAVKFSNWGEYIDPSEIEHENEGVYLDVLDQILPLTDAEGMPIKTGKVDTILAFGNAPFADNRGSSENLATLISNATGATVYNCSVSGSYLAAQHPFFDAGVAPMDAYTFYWLATLAVSGANAHYYPNAVEELGLNAPFEAAEVYNTLTTIDMNEVDVITVMYDASDYLMGHEMYDDANETNIQQFTGNLEAGIELIQENYPHIRIIVMSPTYAYAIDENGDYVSSDMYRYGQDVLSTYVIKEYSSCASRSVTFIDHLYGTITEANASDYLIDNLHLNYEGRKLVTNRFVKALNFYNN